MPVTQGVHTLEIEDSVRKQIMIQLKHQFNLSDQNVEQILNVVVNELVSSTRTTRVMPSPTTSQKVQHKTNTQNYSQEVETLWQALPQKDERTLSTPQIQDTLGELDTFWQNPMPDSISESSFKTSVDQTMTDEEGSSPLQKNHSEKLTNLPEMDTERYIQLEQIGQGGMGEVWRVYDRCLDRHLALKVMREHLSDQKSMQALFIREARLVSRLQHPAIISIHDLGLLQKQFPCFVMDEIVGETFTKRIQALHQNSSHDRWAEGEWTLRRLIDTLYRASEAIAYAHSQGINHRDLKPDNLLLGEHGEVWVIDWGLAGIKGELDVQLGGTPRYMPPEQMNSDDPAVRTSPLLDVFSLGATLYEILAGEAPFANDSIPEILASHKKGRIPKLSHNIKHQRFIPPDLIDLCHEAMSADPLQRPPDASAFALRLRDWLDGAKRKERARTLVAESQLKMAERRKLLEQSRLLNLEANKNLKLMAKNALPEEKALWWSLQTEAQRNEVSAARLEAQRYAMLLSALMEDPTCIEALKTLAARSLERHRRAERARDQPKAHAIADELSRHIEKLPQGDFTRKAATSYLSGMSHFSLTLPAQAHLQLERYEPLHKRLVLKPIMQFEAVESLSLDLPIGSYRLLIQAEGYETVSYPFFLERSCSWDEVGPSTQLTPLPLPKLGSLKPWERYIPRGWFYAGGDPEAPFGLPEHTLWVEGFIISAHPITHAQYLEFLNDLQLRERDDEALQWSPREQSAQQNTDGRLVYSFDRARFIHPKGDEMLKHPVTQISWHSANAYASWLSQRNNLNYRLPLELEWEKAARGVDRRCFPWGDQFDPSYCVMMDSHNDQPKIYPVDYNLIDVSPYGVQGCAGNIREWCLDHYNPDGYQLDQHGLSPRLPTQEELDSLDFKCSRGGSYGNAASRTRSSDRDWWFPNLSYLGRGMRVVRSFEAHESANEAS